MAYPPLPFQVVATQPFLSDSFSFNAGEPITVTSVDPSDGTLFGETRTGLEGWFDGSYVRLASAAAPTSLVVPVPVHAQPSGMPVAHPHSAAATLPVAAYAAHSASPSRAASPMPMQSMTGAVKPFRFATPKDDIQVKYGLLIPEFWQEADDRWREQQGLKEKARKARVDQAVMYVEDETKPTGPTRLKNFPFNAPRNSESYENSLCGCCSDCGVLMCCVFCAPCSLGKARAMADGRSCDCTDVLCCPIVVQTRYTIRAKFGLKEEWFADCLRGCICGPCVHCQDVREMKYRYKAVGQSWSCSGMSMKGPRRMRME